MVGGAEVRVVSSIGLVREKPRVKAIRSVSTFGTTAIISAETVSARETREVASKRLRSLRSWRSDFIT